MATFVQNQRLSALGLANEVRSTRSELKAELAAGIIDLADAIHDERADTLTIYDLLRCVRGIGRTTARYILARVEIRENKRCRELTLRQKALVLAEVLR